MALFVKKLGSRIGGEISGWDARTAQSAEIDELKQLLATHGVLALRDQILAPPEFKIFAGKFGTIESRPPTRDATLCRRHCRRSARR